MDFNKKEEKIVSKEEQEKVDELLSLRDKYRSEKNWIEADKIRDILDEMGVKIADK